ncbi:uncharacterized protein RCO7_14818 [Rhynchosporium graminicola]|uniref:Uncharacterized protein n=1 Tax=Rhynchosporium graminicola TaxID=2792576 RepID=A0A1E1L543_9HELO|nr:uncharacterized protein RCO7_14818 [Rhynchosporium commune]
MECLADQARGRGQVKLHLLSERGGYNKMAATDRKYELPTQWNLSFIVLKKLIVINICCMRETTGIRYKLENRLVAQDGESYTFVKAIYEGGNISDYPKRY